MKAPNGKPILGTLEQLSGRANLVGETIRIEKDEHGADYIEFDYDGDTTIWWDEQRTVKRDEQRVFVDSEGNEWLEGELIAFWQGKGAPQRAQLPDSYPQRKQEDIAFFCEQHGFTWEYPGFLSAPTSGFHFTVGLDEPDVRFVVQIQTEGGEDCDLPEGESGEYQEREQVLACLDAFKKSRGLA